MDKQLYIVICHSCKDCDRMSVALYDKEPTDKMVRQIKEDMGDMWCISSDVIPIKVDEIKLVR